MSDRPRLTMKVNIVHDVRNDESDREKVREGMLEFLNEEAEDLRIETLEDVDAELQNGVEHGRIAVGHTASAVFLELAPKRFSGDSLQSLTNTVANELGHHHYADNVELEYWLLEATEPGTRV